MYIEKESKSLKDIMKDYMDIKKDYMDARKQHTDIEILHVYNTKIQELIPQMEETEALMKEAMDYAVFWAKNERWAKNKRYDFLSLKLNELSEKYHIELDIKYQNFCFCEISFNERSASLWYHLRENNQLINDYMRLQEYITQEIEGVEYRIEEQLMRCPDLIYDTELCIANFKEFYKELTEYIRNECLRDTHYYSDFITEISKESDKTELVEHNEEKED